VVIRLAVVGRFKTVTLPLIEPVIVEYPLPMERAVDYVYFLAAEV